MVRSRSLGPAAFLPAPHLKELIEGTREFLAEHGFYAINRKKLIP
jgi:hypothetical protein